MTDLIELAERCEQATGPDRDLDGMIGAIVGCEFHSAEVVREYAHDDYGWGGKGPHWAGTANSLGVLKFTASLDAAMTLVPEGAEVVMQNFGGPGPMALVYPTERHIAAKTLPLALCAAALRAKAVE